MKRIYASTERENLMDELDTLYTKVCKAGYCDTADKILDSCGASADDSSDEGFMVTMSESDLKSAIDRLTKLKESITF